MSNDAKHTPGPWRLSENSDGTITIHATDEGGCRVAEVDTENVDDHSIALADARLIAAAPDLLAALRPLVAEACHAGWASGDCFTVNRPRPHCTRCEAVAAVRKATEGGDR